MSNEMRISNILKDLGIPTSIRGYHYLRYAIEVVIEDEDNSLVFSVIKRLYPKIATQFNTTPSRVERAMRHAIEVGWYRGNMETQKKLFGYSVNRDKGNPTNSEFVATVMDWIILERKSEVEAG